MGQYVLAYHGGGEGGEPTEEQMAQIQAAWGGFFEGLGSAVVNPGNPIGASKTIASDGSVSDGGGANPVTGYSIIEAGSLDAALALVKNCPIFDAGGSVEVAETIAM